MANNLQALTEAIQAFKKFKKNSANENEILQCEHRTRLGPQARSQQRGPAASSRHHLQRLAAALLILLYAFFERVPEDKRLQVMYCLAQTVI